LGSKIPNYKGIGIASINKPDPVTSGFGVQKFNDSNQSAPPPLSLAPARSAMAVRHSCAKIELAVEDPKEETGSIFVKATWHPTKFSLAVTDGMDAWFCHASDGEVKIRAEQWDQPVSEYLDLAERYLGLQQPGSNYSFDDASNDQRRVRYFPLIDSLLNELNFLVLLFQFVLPVTATFVLN
jgi:hypothetical protein